MATRALAASLREFSRLPRRDCINKTEKGREREIVLVVEAELVAEEKVEVIEIKNCREGIQSFEREAGKFYFLWRGHWREIMK